MSKQGGRFRKYIPTYLIHLICSDLFASSVSRDALHPLDPVAHHQRHITAAQSGDRMALLENKP